MTDFMYAEINVVGIVLLFLLLNNMNKDNKNIPFDQKLFNGCLVMNILIFLLDTGMWLIDGKTGAISKTFNYIVTMLYYVSNPLICFLWLLYTEFKIYESRIGLLKHIRFYIIPCVINTVLCLISPFTFWMFIIDAENNYMRGPYFWVMALVALSYLVYSCCISFIYALKNGWEENKRIIVHLLVFPMGTVIASIIQIMFFGVSIIWISAALAFTSIYINIQSGEISTDYLTGLYNRRRLDEHLQRQMMMRKKDHHLFSIMLDLDGFKTINDKYGHAAGDNVLVEMADLLRQACKGSDDFIARMGGDEFIIVGERNEIGAIKRLMEDINTKAVEHNNRHQADCVIRPSMGYSVFEKDDTLDSFIAAADKEMYRNKQERKAAH